MSQRAKYVVKALFLAIGYAIGLPIVISGVSGEVSLGMVLVGLAFCGLPFGISFYNYGKRNEDNASVVVYNMDDSGNYYRAGTWKKFAWALLGLVLGLVATPIMIISLIIKAITYVDDRYILKYMDKLLELLPEMKKENLYISLLCYRSNEEAVLNFINKYPENVQEIMSKIKGISEDTAVTFALTTSQKQQEFWSAFPKNVKEVLTEYPSIKVNEAVRGLMLPQKRKEKYFRNLSK